MENKNCVAFWEAFVDENWVKTDWNEVGLWCCSYFCSWKAELNCYAAATDILGGYAAAEQIFFSMF